MTAADSDLVARMAAGDPDAPDAIADRYRDRIRRYFVTMIGDESAAEDLSQVALQRGFERIATLQDPARLRPWLFAIAVNLARAHLRDRLRRGDSVSLDEDPDGPPAAARRSALSSVMHRESAAVLALAIDRLPVLLRESFVLHLIEGLPYDDIAEITGASPGTLHVRTHRAKALLRRQLGSVVDTFWSQERGSRPG